MPAGVPVATVALNGAKNAGLLAAQIIGSADANIGNAMEDYKSTMEAEVLAKVDKMKVDFNNEFDK
jgi:5-(carboxyamino)imidazole ribonucleotide mutase